MAGAIGARFEYCFCHAADGVWSEGETVAVAGAGDFDLDHAVAF